MREILFRAKRIDNGEWVEGYVVRYGYNKKEKWYIVPEYASDLYTFEIDEKTICQYTGMTDKNNNKIWEHDIIEGTFWGFMMPVENYVFEISWHEDVAGWYRNVMDANNEVIGNIFDNPELLNK